MQIPISDLAWFFSLRRVTKTLFEDFEDALRLYPKVPLFNRILAWVLSTHSGDRLRDGVRAVELAMKLCELSEWKSSHEKEILAAALAESGVFHFAVLYEMRASDDSARADGDTMRERLELCMQITLFHDSRW